MGWGPALLGAPGLGALHWGGCSGGCLGCTRGAECVRSCTGAEMQLRTALLLRCQIFKSENPIHCRSHVSEFKFPLP